LRCRRRNSKRSAVEGGRFARICSIVNGTVYFFGSVGFLGAAAGVDGTVAGRGDVAAAVVIEAVAVGCGVAENAAVVKVHTRKAITPLCVNRRTNGFPVSVPIESEIEFIHILYGFD